jgi:hypothetical protein
MVSPELARQYTARGIGLIDPGEGVLCLLRELAWGDPAITSVVYMASADGPPATADPQAGGHQ